MHAKLIWLTIILFLCGCHNFTIHNVRFDDDITVTKVEDQRYQIVWSRQKVMSYDGSPHYEFNRRMWISSSYLESLVEGPIAKGDDYRLWNNKLLKREEIKLRMKSLDTKADKYNFPAINGK